mgnify:CR=1 FL=1
MNVFEFNRVVEIIKEKSERGEISDEALADTLESIEVQRNEKLDNVAGWIEQNQMNANYYSKKAKKYEAEAKKYKNKNNYLMEFLTQAIDDSGQKEIRTKNHILKPRNYKDSVIVEATEKLPIDYIVCSEVVKPNKKLIYEDLKKGKQIKGAHLKHNRGTTIK